MRYLLLNHATACFAVLFIAAMVVFRFALWPYVVNTYGDIGFVVTLICIFSLGFLLDRRA